MALGCLCLPVPAQAGLHSHRAASGCRQTTCPQGHRHWKWGRGSTGRSSAGAVPTTRELLLDTPGGCSGSDRSRVPRLGLGLGIPGTLPWSSLSLDMAQEQTSLRQTWLTHPGCVPRLRATAGSAGRGWGWGTGGSCLRPSEGPMLMCTLCPGSGCQGWGAWLAGPGWQGWTEDRVVFLALVPRLPPLPGTWHLQPL